MGWLEPITVSQERCRGGHLGAAPMQGSNEPKLPGCCIWDEWRLLPFVTYLLTKAEGMMVAASAWFCRPASDPLPEPPPPIRH